MERTLPLALQTYSTPKGIEVLTITAGIGNGWEFSPACQQDSPPLRVGVRDPSC